MRNWVQYPLYFLQVWGGRGKTNNLPILMYFAKQKGSLSCAAKSDLIRCIGDQKLTKRDCNDTKAQTGCNCNWPLLASNYEPGCWKVSRSSHPWDLLDEVSGCCISQCLYFKCLVGSWLSSCTLVDSGLRSLLSCRNKV